jgi:DNA-binding LacI/PurR family transcriptional regulator
MGKKYLRVQYELEDLIRTGILKSGDRLPTEKELCQKYLVSRITAGKAVNELVLRGLVERFPRRGTFVKNRKMQEGGFFFFILPALTNFQQNSAIEHFSRTLNESKSNIAILLAADNNELTENIIAASNSNCAGIAIHPSVMQERNSKLLKTIYSTHRPTVIFYRELYGYNGIQIIIDEEQGAALAATHLAEMGYRNLAFIGVDQGSRAQTLRYKGFQEACRNLGIDSKQYPILIFNNPFQYPNLKELFFSNNAPNGLVVVSEYHAIMAYDVLTSMGLRVPDDLAIITCVGSVVSAGTEVSLSAVEFPEKQIINEVTDILQQMNLGLTPYNAKYIKKIPGSLVIRDSSGGIKRRRHDYLQEFISI